MNLAQATKLVLEELGLAPSEEAPIQRALPWRPSLALGRRTEDVRPVFWRNRNSSYVARTQTWDEYPNGRWTDSRSPAFGEVDAYGVRLKGTNEQNIKLWGEPKSIKDLSEIFIRFLEGKLDRLPWSDSPISAEASDIKDHLVNLNQRGFLTINSQPAVNGVKSSHPIYGWGPKNGFVYQKAYLELLVPPSLIDELTARIEKNDDLTYHAIRKNGELRTNTHDSPNALTWGIFAGREIIQPTIVETISFLAWKDEAYRLGEDWSKCHDSASPSRKLIQQVMDDWYLVNIGKNTFSHHSNQLTNGSSSRQRLPPKQRRLRIIQRPRSQGSQRRAAPRQAGDQRLRRAERSCNQKLKKHHHFFLTGLDLLDSSRSSPFQPLSTLLTTITT
jgi:methylenetetrahydrofolate reductase (NADPH)